MGGHGPLRHMNPNMERNLNAAAAAGGLLNYGIQGHEQAMNIRINQQMQQQAFKAQQQASAQQQMYLHQHAQEGHGHGHGQGPYRGQESSIHHPSQYFNQAPAMREADSQMMTRNFMAEQMMRASPQLGSQMGSIGSGLGQDYATGSQNRRNVGIIPMGSDLNLNPSISESYSAFSVRRSLSDSSHNLLGGSEGVGPRNLNTFGTALDGGQMRRYNDLSLGGALGLGSESGHERGNNVYDLSNGQDRPPERRFSEVFREHSEGTSRDSLGTPGFGHSLSLNNSSHSSRRPSVSMQLAAKSFSERDKVERDRSLGIESWSEPTFSLDRGDCMDDRLRDRDSRYGENDFNIEVNSELFTSAALGGSSNQMLGEESTSEFYDQRGQGLGRGYQQSLARDSYQSQGGQGLLGQGQNHSKTASSLFLQQRDDDLMYEQEYSIRDRQHQLQTLALQRQDDEEQHQRLILQNQQAGVQRLAFRPPQNIFDPKKWIQ